jgi:hypothetical protein
MDEWMAGIFFDEWWWMMMSGVDFLGSVGVQTDFLRQSRKEIHKDTGFHRAPGWNSASKTAAYCICWCFVLGCIWIYQLCLVGHISKFWRLKEVVYFVGEPAMISQTWFEGTFQGPPHTVFPEQHILNQSMNHQFPRFWYEAQIMVIPSPLVKH